MRTACTNYGKNQEKVAVIEARQGADQIVFTSCESQKSQTGC